MPPPVKFQFPLGATSADVHQQLVDSPVDGPGGISRQFEIPRAEPDATMSRDHGTPYG